jgi:hypothetical protein
VHQDRPVLARIADYFHDEVPAKVSTAATSVSGPPRRSFAKGQAGRVRLQPGNLRDVAKKTTL